MSIDDRKFSILLVDDEKSIRITISMLLEEAGYEVFTASNGLEALSVLREYVIDLMITDLRMSGMNGIELMREAHRIDPTLEVVLISAYSDIESVVEAIKAGAYDYIIKSFQNEELLLTVSKVKEKKWLQAENQAIKKRLENRYSSGDYVFRDPKMGIIVEHLEKIAKSNATVLLTGESGTGKEVLARLIHKKSQRSGQRFSVIDCSSMAATLLESEIFGYEKGAFTGAVAKKIGKFEAADKVYVL